jgi:hypothetical protein
MGLFDILSITTLLPAILASDLDGQIVTNSDSITAFVPDEYTDKDVSLPSGGIVTIQLYGNFTEEPHPRRRAWVPTSNPSN